MRRPVTISPLAALGEMLGFSFFMAAIFVALYVAAPKQPAMHSEFAQEQNQ